jgi:hypothetical protein
MEGKSTKYWRNAGEKRKGTWRRRRENYYQRNGYASEKWKDWEKGTKTRISKTKWRESKREGEKGNGRITEWRRKGDKMDGRDMREEEKDREEEEWRIGIRKVILFGKFWNCYFMFIYGK